MFEAPGTDERVYVVTGAASGIGRAVAGILAGRGARALVLDIDLDGLSHAAAQGGWDPARIALARLDVRDPGAWEGAMDVAEGRWGRLDVLYNIAGYLRPGWVAEVEAEDVDRHFDINVKGLIHGTRAAARRMVRRGAGHIVNVGSLAALAPIPGIALYSASKFAVRGFSLAAAQELAPQGVAVTVVCPDAVQTPMLDLQVDFPQAAMTFSGSRALTAAEVAGVLTGRVLERRPFEVVLPAGRGILARLGGLAPELTSALQPVLSRKGRAVQARLKGGRA